MNHHTTAKFWSLHAKLPIEIQEAADKAFELLKSNPRHPSLQFKKLGEVWSARVTLNYRAIAVETTDGFLWLWIGSHDEYDALF